jgi:hypothetical protein
MVQAYIFKSICTSRLLHIYMQMFHTSMSAEFQGTLVKWGTSIGLAIPKPIRDGMKLKAGDKIRMLLRDNMICIQKVKQ